MKTNRLSWITCILLPLLLWSCKPDHVEPNSGSASDSPAALQGNVDPQPDPQEICSDRESHVFIDQYGNQIVSYCGGVPCPPHGEMKWGTAEYLNSPEEFVINITLAPNWYIDVVNNFTGPEVDLTIVNGLPQVDISWRVIDVNPLVNATQIRVAKTDLDPDYQVVTQIIAYQNDITGNIDPLSVTELFAFNDAWNDALVPEQNTLSPMISNWTFADCPAEIKTVTKGSCHRCDAEVSVDFLDCDKIEVTSCKTINNVVLIYDDCEWEKFDNLNTVTGAFEASAIHQGKSISHVYVKSGCYESQEGPDFGRRFDAPCLNKACPIVTSGGSK